MAFGKGVRMPALNPEQNVRALCFEHHIEMTVREIPLKTTGKPKPTFAHCCPEAGCFVSYTTSRGYLVAGLDGNPIPSEITPHVSCPADTRPMYLAEVNLEKRSYRLWKCPECGNTKTNEDLWMVSGAK
jgi:hypothetical protein